MIIKWKKKKINENKNWYKEDKWEDGEEGRKYDEEEEEEEEEEDEIKLHIEGGKKRHNNKK